jgi:hypothetical protein
MSKQAKTTAAAAAAAVDTSPCSLCKDLLMTEIQAIIQINHGVLTSDNKTILEALPLLNTKGLVSVIFNMMTEKQDASIDSRFSPQKLAPIVTITRDGGFKKLVSPVDENFSTRSKKMAFLLLNGGSTLQDHSCTMMPMENSVALSVKLRLCLLKTNSRSIAQEEANTEI